MRPALFAMAAGSLLSIALATAADRNDQVPDASPIYGVKLPPDYRDWALIAPALEAAPLHELRAVLGNPVAIDAYKSGILPFPDGAILVKLAWKQSRSSEFEAASVPGSTTASGVQIMVKDSTRYASTAGWGFGRFVDGVPADEAQHATCFACHQALVKEHDFVFTRWAP